ncbi:TPA: hypothetical protein RQK14_001565 [Vibrio vulnificus]|nr:hypothetical protein [Vibrio vulnificus]
MNKTLKLALLPAAVASAMFANSAFAGTEACFEVYKSANNALAANAHETLYTPAACVVNGNGTDVSNQLSAQAPATVAWELTKDFTLDAENVNAANETLNIVYIPTTDIPPASRIVLSLDGATWAAENNNQIHLIKAEEVAGPAIAFSAVASTDGNVTGENDITFVTKAGVTIGAGTRLVLSLANNIADDTAADIVSPKVRIQNTGCAPENAKVTIIAKEVKTDAGQSIEGGATKTPFTLADISSQFGLGVNSQNATQVEVDAEAPSYRLKFVTEKAGGNWVGQVTESAFFWETEFTNDLRLDQSVAVDGSDEVQLKFYSSSDAGASVRYSALRMLDGTTALDASQASHIKAAAAEIEMNDVTNTLPLGTDASAVQTYDANDVFLSAPSVLNTTKVAYKVENTDLVNGVMNFNYTVDANFGLNLFDDKHLDNNFCSPVQDVANVGVNGAVLKVPYAYDTDKNWVRITNEHTSDAEITVDVFGETSDGSGTVTKTFTLGNVAAKDSVLYTADDIVKLYKDGYTGDVSKLINRYTFTFTVTAPKNAVHGVSVQKIPGGVDRVLPVLDQNDWAQ